MPTRLNPYLSFRDNAREAMERYAEVLGGELQISTFADMHASDDPAEQVKVMHAQLEVGELFLMGADTPKDMEVAPNGQVSISGDDEATLTRWFQGLADGGTITAPLEKAPWGDTFGMCTDRFGVTWMVNITSDPQ